MVMNGTTEKSLAHAAGALGALAKQDMENSSIIMKRIIELLHKVSGQKGVRLLHTLAVLCDNQSLTQLAMAKMGGIEPLTHWLLSAESDVEQVHAAALQSPPSQVGGVVDFLKIESNSWIP